MHLLGLNWQLQPADGHTFNNGIRTGLPGNDDVATMPSGGKGEVTAAACPLEVTGKFRAPANGFRFSNPHLGRYAKRKRNGGTKSSPFLGSPVQSHLLFLSVSCVWLESLRVGTVPSQCKMPTYAIWSDLKASQGPGRSGSKSGSSSRRKSCLVKRAASSRQHMPLDQSPLPRGETQPPQGGSAAWRERDSELFRFGREEKRVLTTREQSSSSLNSKGDNENVY